MGTALGPAVAALLLLLFVARIRGADEPFVRPILFANRGYVTGFVAAAFMQAANFALPFLTPLLLAQVHGLPLDRIGLLLTPGAVTSALLARTGGQLGDRRGALYLFRVGLALLGTCFIMLSVIAGLSVGVIVISLVLGTVGMTLTQISLSKWIAQTLPREQTGVGMGFVSMLNFLAGATAGALYSRVIDQSLHHSGLAELFPDAFNFRLIYTVLGVSCVVLLVMSCRYRYGTYGDELMEPDYVTKSDAGLAAKAR